MTKPLNIIVLAKQVPDTRSVGKDSMNVDGTINRAALPVVINPDDMKALEQALRLKELFPGSAIQVLTMGPLRAADALAYVTPATITLAPFNFANLANIRPIGPIPKTPTVSPG